VNKRIASSTRVLPAISIPTAPPTNLGGESEVGESEEAAQRSEMQRMTKQRREITGDVVVGKVEKTQRR
jgi:hypothetical protein